MLKMHFYKKMSITWKLYDRFFLYYISADKPQSSLSLKSIVTVGLAAQNAHWSNFTLQSNANTFVKVDAQIEEECRRTLSYLQGYSCPKLYCKKLSTVRNTRRATWMRGRLKELLFIKVAAFLPFSFWKDISTKQNIASTEIAYLFLAPKVPVLKRNTDTISRTSTDPFSATTKTLVFGNLFKLVRFAITFPRAVCHWG